MTINHSRQTGAALFMSLIFLLVLTILGLASMNDSVMQTKMASAVQDSNIALQGAESAARDAENQIETNVASLVLFTDEGNAGLYSNTSSTLPDYFNQGSWASDSTKTISGSTVVKGVKEQPRYFIQYVGFVNQEDANASINMSNYSHEAGTGDVHGFKIISRSTGASGNTQRLIESYYGKRF